MKLWMCRLIWCALAAYDIQTLQIVAVQKPLLFSYGKYPKISYTSFSDKMLYENSAKLLQTQIILVNFIYQLV